MKATETNLLEFLREPKQFVIPIYQRTYRMNGNIEVDFSSFSQLEDIMFLVHQAFQKHNNK